MKKQKDKLPTEFRGCMWDAGWEFDAPCILYFPFKRYGVGGNAHHLHDMVDDICIDLSLGKEANRDFTESCRKEFEWRGWSESGFRTRKNAWHLRFMVRWYRDEDGELCHESKLVGEKYGPFQARHAKKKGKVRK